MSEQVIESAAKGLGSSVALQIASKLVTFGMRVAIVRLLGPQLFAFSEFYFLPERVSGGLPYVRTLIFNRACSRQAEHFSPSSWRFSLLLLTTTSIRMNSRLRWFSRV
mmetsp:Transcript_6570/g.28030  ORF Transcript_6570/g.28030 Transcript_6570/m.28030 type:complete len:108 (+) Transcript_6570:412-735(+)